MTELFAWVAEVHPEAGGGSWDEVDHGGSDRRFWRGRGAASGLVASCYGPDKEENGRYAACADFLRARGVSVPAVLAHDGSRRFLLMEDAGMEDLWSRRGAPWEERRGLYVRALEQAALVHAVDLREAERAGVLREPFDAALYRWEQDYFFEHFLGRAEAAELCGNLPLDEQAEALALQPRVVVHRDLQSQNVMLAGDGVALIDFQGMRAGLAGYDVASLLYDPYVPMAAAERDDLVSVYASLAGRSDGAAWHAELRACARQRLMQALGAYGFLGRVKGREAFLAHIPVAAARLAELCDAEPEWRLLAGAVRRTAGFGP